MSWLMQWNEDAWVRPVMTDDAGHGDDAGCQRTTVRFLAGSGVTDGSGRWTLELDPAVLCEPVGLVRSVSFVATATFNAHLDALPMPSYLQTGYTAAGGHVTLHAWSWGCRCDPRPNVRFDYHVAIAYDFVV
jgi:hypothetical protein